jgi:preprotein translocase subunit SecG
VREKLESIEKMEQIILVVHVIAAIALIGFILIQQGKGAEVGASFGSGASQTVFGSQGSGNFLTRATAVLVTIFFMTSLTLGYLSARQGKPQDLDELLKKVQPAVSEKQDKDIPAVPK